MNDLSRATRTPGSDHDDELEPRRRRRPLAIDGSLVGDGLAPATRPHGVLRRLLETLLFSLAGPAIGVALWPGDPLLLDNGTPWLLATGPVLIGGLYGTRYGVGAALLAMGSILIERNAAMLGESVFDGLPLAPLAFGPGFAFHALALLLIGLVCGELSTRWRRQVRQLTLLSDHQARRQEAFLRHYHVLRISHDQLLEHLAGAPFTLRDTLIQLSRRMATRCRDNPIDSGNESNGDLPALARLGDDILVFIGQHTRVQQAALLPIDEHGGAAPPVAWLGAATPLSMTHPMLAECLARGEVVGLKDMLAADDTTPLCVVPLVDAQQRLHGLVVVMDIPFVDFHDGQLQRLAVIGACLGDLLSAPVDAAESLGDALARWVRHAQRHRLASTLVGVTLSTALVAGFADAISSIVRRHKRSLDNSWEVPLDSGRWRALVILPLTDAHGESAYRARLTAELEALFDTTALPEGVEVFSIAIRPGSDPASLTRRLLSDEVAHAR